MNTAIQPHDPPAAEAAHPRCDDRRPSRQPIHYLADCLFIALLATPFLLLAPRAMTGSSGGLPEAIVASETAAPYLLPMAGAGPDREASRPVMEGAARAPGGAGGR